MQQDNEQLHIETNEVRGGSSPNVVRWVLAASLVLAIGAMSVIWLIPALS